MTPIHWIQLPIPGALGIMPRPRGGEWLIEEVRAWRSAGVQKVVSALEPLEEAFLELGAEESLCSRFGIAFERFALMDRTTPGNDSKAREAVVRLAEAVAEGTSVVVHCRLGIGRSGMICAATLVALGLEPSEAFLRVEAARGLRVPDTREQLEWVYDFARHRGRPTRLTLGDMDDT